MGPVLIHHVHLTLPAEHKRGQVSAFTAKACPDRKPDAGFVFFFPPPTKVAGGEQGGVGRRGWWWGVGRGRGP